MNAAKQKTSQTSTPETYVPVEGFLDWFVSIVRHLKRGIKGSECWGNAALGVVLRCRADAERVSKKKKDDCPDIQSGCDLPSVAPGSCGSVGVNSGPLTGRS